MRPTTDIADAPAALPFPASAADAAGAPRVILLGTAATLAELAAALEETRPSHQIVERLCIHASNESEAFAALDRVAADLAIVSFPVALSPLAARCVKAVERRGIPWRWVPALVDLLAGRVAAPSWLRQVGQQDAAPQGVALPGLLATIDPVRLIDRRPRPLDEQAIRRSIHDKAVLITGAGGSIGSELARSVCRFQPSRLILVERSENALFEIDRHIARVWPDIPRAAVLHDVTDAPGTLRLIESRRPQVIFHAAAHKHVPMMEDHPAQAVENNLYGTRSIAQAADRHGVERFVMISSDKAVNPSSVMGATKRLAELFIQHLSARSATIHCMVRFGNVLGSACSVLPIWTEQLSRGGPITVTHPDMTRYFMTIPEAAGLVMQSAAYAGLGGRRGEVFLLDMGRPIRIVDLAHRFIRHHGLEPGADVEVRFTGVRPGEKLYEELAYDGEEMIPTPHPSVRLWRSDPPDPAAMARTLATFDRLRGSAGPFTHLWQNATSDAILAAIRVAVPEMVRSAAG